ncbi:hypothetical protein BDZ94DRAFT_588629 [Collybia nuda]|uniref:DUF6535 domain-containing protein n=1 Tax=Collybia nuda TaxID=64659 RepID=A0A9P6CF69_9AGAR|nr:hypothetical protein BDZ94DRAFT_588629 [Collybia nuda]
MNPQNTPLFNDTDLEAQATPGNGRSHTPSFHTTGSHNPTLHPDPTRLGEEPRGEYSAKAEAFNNVSPSEPEWKPWKLNDPYLSKFPKDEQAMEEWVKVMKESDDGMCKGWTDQIDTLIIFAGLFSATVTAFTIESYKWLDEGPAEMLARLQLRALLNETSDSTTVDRLAPATFDVNPSSVLINTLWFSSLTIALAAVVISILCKQWLYEYQRYENFTEKEIFLIHGLRYRGLQAWKVPTIIAFLPIFLQTALMLFLVGLLILLGPLQTVVASVTTAIVGLTFLFLVITTVLPAMQYIFPMFNTQCAYKSSQSWSFLLISTFWLFDFLLFTNWATFDRWEVTRVCDGTGRTLSRVYELLSSGVDAFRKIYGFLAESSLKPTINADLILLSDFVTGLDPSRKAEIITAVPLNIQETMNFRRLEQLKGYIKQGRTERLKPMSDAPDPTFQSGFYELKSVNHKYQLRSQMVLGQFLRRDDHISDSEVFNRYIEHWARCINDTSNDMQNKAPWKTGDKQWREIFWPTNLAHHVDIQWDPEIASRIIKLYSYLLKTNQFSLRAMYCLAAMYSSFMESHRQQAISPPPFTLLKDIQDWINRVADIDIVQGANNADLVTFCLVGKQKNIFSDPTHLSDLEKEFLESFARFFVDFYQRRDVSNELGGRLNPQPNPSLAILRGYLDQNTYTSFETR